MHEHTVYKGELNNMACTHPSKVNGTTLQWLDRGSDFWEQISISSCKNHHSCVRGSRAAFVLSQPPITANNADLIAHNNKDMISLQRGIRQNFLSQRVALVWHRTRQKSFVAGRKPVSMMRFILCIWSNIMTSRIWRCSRMFSVTEWRYAAHFGQNQGVLLWWKTSTAFP